jgi:hypothetical protein
MNSVKFINTEQACFAKLATQAKSELTLRIHSDQYSSISLFKWIKRSVIIIGRSTLDVQCSMFISFFIRLDRPFVRPVEALNPEPLNL